MARQCKAQRSELEAFLIELTDNLADRVRFLISEFKFEFSNFYEFCHVQVVLIDFV